MFGQRFAQSVPEGCLRDSHREKSSACSCTQPKPKNTSLPGDIHGPMSGGTFGGMQEHEETDYPLFSMLYTSFQVDPTSTKHESRHHKVAAFLLRLALMNSDARGRVHVVDVIPHRLEPKKKSSSLGESLRPSELADAERRVLWSCWRGFY